jgi:hypothetical protein
MIVRNVLAVLATGLLGTCLSMWAIGRGGLMGLALPALVLIAWVWVFVTVIVRNRRDRRDRRIAALRRRQRQRWSETGSRQHPTR